MGLNKTPQSNRIHIGIFGKVNSGKSTLLNTITNQNSAIVSSQQGTTTDPVYKAMELHGIGPVVFVDTAGFEDHTKLREQRLEKSKEVASKSDVALVLFVDDDMKEGVKWIQYLNEQNCKVIPIINKIHGKNIEVLREKLEQEIKEEIICVDVAKLEAMKDIHESIIRNLPEHYQEESILRELVKEEDLVLLVMPQDIQAPKGRLILPQVQTMRELLDRHCIVVSCTKEKLEITLKKLTHDPDLIICDSQIFKDVYNLKPVQSKLTSFSVLFAQYKGDLDCFIEGAKSLDTLPEDAHILIAEACTHAPLSEDIGRVKIPTLLKKKYGNNLRIDITSGNDFPKDVSDYDLIIHCGGCMFNRKYVLSRIQIAQSQNIAITNYGICIAYLSGILNKIELI